MRSQDWRLCQHSHVSWVRVNWQQICILWTLAWVGRAENLRVAGESWDNTIPYQHLLYCLVKLLLHKPWHKPHSFLAYCWKQRPFDTRKDYPGLGHHTMAMQTWSSSAQSGLTLTIYSTLTYLPPQRTNLNLGKWEKWDNCWLHF